MLPHLPLLLRTAVLHVLRLSPQSPYLNLKTALIVNVLRAYINPPNPKTISETKEFLNRFPSIKGKIWVSNYSVPAPTYETQSAIKEFFSTAINALAQDGRVYNGPMPEVKAVEGEWTGYRENTTGESRLPEGLSERELYGEMMKEVKGKATVLYFHGGAYWLMDPATHRPTTTTLSKVTGGRVFSVRYRLAPENPFPAAVVDGLVSYLGLLYPAEGAFHTAIPPEEIVFAGDSAGGNLCLSLLQLILHLHRTNQRQILWNGHLVDIPLPAGVAVNSPWTDVTHSSPSCVSNAPFDYLPEPSILKSAEDKRPPCGIWPSTPRRRHIYVADELITHPLVSVVLAKSWEGSPPVYICTGWELLADEDKYVAKKMWEAGVRVRFEEYEGMPHCFGLIFPGLQEARRCFNGWGGFIRQVVEEGEGEQGSRFLTVKAGTLEEAEIKGEELIPFLARLFYISLSPPPISSSPSPSPHHFSPYIPPPVGYPSPTMDKHLKALQSLSKTLTALYKTRTPYRINHGSTNSTRPRPSTSQQIDISSLNNVLSVNPQSKTALVEPNVPMDKLVEATLSHGLVPHVVMEFPGITAGGGFAGTAGESSSFKHGFFDETVAKVEMVLGDGKIVNFGPEDKEKGDLFRGAAGAVGTLGLTTCLEIKLMDAKRFVKTRYHRTGSVAETVELIRKEVRNDKNDYVDGILFGKDHGVVVTGELTDVKPDGGEVRTFSSGWDEWFYLHAKKQPRGVVTEEYIPLAEYLFRYDRGGFWVGAAAFEYFKFVPFTKFFRWFLDDFLHTRMMYRALHGSGESARFIVQDIAMPFETTVPFVDYTADSLNIWPLWLCPLKRRGPPTFHPFTTLPEGIEPKEEDMMLNVGVWGWGPKQPAEFVAKNRELEAKVRELGGMKWLYAHTYYPQEEFWKMYDGREWYDKLREKYNASHLPSVWDKVHVDPEAAGNKKRHWLKRQPPLGGFYGIWKSIQSKDYFLHRNATWKWKGEE
ncbi:alpha/beta hydrolase fold-domain-containing protein [Triangularia setosa]|uniref:Delta(24)-sterol reductase n=1 Tax=Triangularia setosa TaxID=2587417 RepID=A0AAN7A1U3_9PEZI|nr:alpha/beta hydrolase fold-domain-containing protein [Podospora setosa]